MGEEEWRQLEEESCVGRPPPRSVSLETLVPSEDFSQPRRRKFTQIFDKSDPLNPTDLRRRLEQVSKPMREVKSQEGKVSDEKQLDVEEKLKTETSKSILDPLTEKLEEIAEKLDKERMEAEAKWEKSQRELEEVHSLVEDILRGLSRIFTGFINSIQGFFFCFIFAVLLLAIGLRRNP